ncbi:hypothetical protein KIPB_016339, partial [Kipferlia bialata]|eukprot:g16339.t1
MAPPANDAPGVAEWASQCTVPGVLEAVEKCMGGRGTK